MSVEIENLLSETRRFPPSPEFVAQAIAKPELYEQAKNDRLGFWADRARELYWHKPFTQILDWSNAPFAKWFHDGELNVSYNCLDREDHPDERRRC
jgi:acetyl-CoA synthetase